MKSLILILALIVITGAAMAYSGRVKPAGHQPPPPLPVVSAGGGILNLSGHLVQTHVLKGSSGKVSLVTQSAAPGVDVHAAGDPRYSPSSRSSPSGPRARSPRPVPTRWPACRRT